MDADLIVIGAGQAGLAAAYAAERAGRDEVVEYLSACAADLTADIRLGHRVVSVEREPGGFRVRGEDGSELEARGLIAATGSFGSPHRPSLSGLDSFTGQVLHASEYRSQRSVQGERVVVVGGGNSAVQIAVELARSARVTLTTRSPLRWIGQRPLGRDLHWWLTRTGLDTAPIGRWPNTAQPVVDDGTYRAALAGEASRRQACCARAAYA